MRIRTLLNPFSCNHRFIKQSWDSIFPDFNGTLDVEIGFGNGGFIQHYAQSHPARSVVGFEIKTRQVAFAKENLQEAGIANAHLFWGNGQLGLEDLFDDGTIDRIFIFHPDPWPKTKHQKRRLLTESFLQLLHKKLKQGGCLFIATDVPDLWDYMEELINQSDLFIPSSDDQFWTTLYQTSWKHMSIEKKRPLFFQTFTALPTKIEK